MKCLAAWLNGSTLASINKVTVCRAQLVLRWVTVCRQVNHSGKLSLLPSAGQKMSAIQSAMTHCGRKVKAGMVRSTCEWMYGWQVKLCDPLLTCAIPECFRHEFLMINYYYYYNYYIRLTAFFSTTTWVSRPQITTPVSHHSVLQAGCLPATQPTASKP